MMLTSWKKSFNSQKIRPNLIPSKIVPIGWVDLNSKIKFLICHWTWEIGWIWHYLKNLVTRFWPCQIASRFFRRGSSYFLEAQNNSIELPDVNDHKASWFSSQMPNTAYLQSPMTNFKSYFRIQMHSYNRYNF